MTNHERLMVIREVHASLDAWLDAARKLPDPSAHPPDTVEKLSRQVARVASALREVSTELRDSAEWKAEIAAYRETLREMRARLHNFEITLRIRKDQINKSGAQMGVVRSWADLAKHIG